MNYSEIEEIFNNSKAGKRYLELLESLKDKTITEKESYNIRNKTNIAFGQERKHQGCFYTEKERSYISFCYIPKLMYEKYNIRVAPNEPTVKYTKKTAPTLTEGWITYIVVMIVISIFNERIFGWIMVTIMFLIWRASEINKYN